MTRFDQTNPNFDQWLDGFVRGESTSNDETSNDDPVSRQLRNAASQFHDLAGRAEQLTGDPATNERLDHIWENVMMNAQVPAAAGIGSGGVVSAGSTGRANPLFARQRWPAIVNSLVAAALIIGLSFGVWQTFQGLNSSGGGGDDGGMEVEFSALVQAGSTPQATPAVYDPPTADDCKVEPLTVDQVLEIVDRYAPNTEYVQVPEDKPVPDVATLNGSPSGINPNQETMDAIVAVHREWMTCALAKSQFQMWALTNRITIANEVVDRVYPVYRTREEGRVLLEELRDHGTVNSKPFYFPTDVVYIDPDPKNSVQIEAGNVQPGWIRYDAAGNVVNSGSSSFTELMGQTPVSGRSYYLYVWDRTDGGWKTYQNDAAGLA